MSAGTESVRVGLVGCGGISRSHLAAYTVVEEAELVACCDSDVERARDFADAAGISDAVTDYRDLLARDDVAMIDICTNDESHARIAIDAAHAGKHVLIEKPFATTRADGESVLAAVREAGVKGMCAQSQRWSPRMREVRRIIDSGEIGAPVFARFASPSSPFWREDEAERWQHRPATWLLVHNGMHSFDLMTWLLGSAPRRVMARSHPGQSWLPVHEYVTCSIRFEGGAIAHTEENRIMQPPGYPFHVELYVVGTRGTLDLSDRLTHSASVYDSDGFTPLGAHVTYEPTDPDGPFAGEIRDFARCVIDDAQPPIPLAESVRVLTAVLAAAESMTTGEAVEIPRE